MRPESHPPPPPAALAVGRSDAALVDADGEVRMVSFAEARTALSEGPHLICHAPSLLRRLESAPPQEFLLDVLELFAFVRPGETILPSPRGLASAVGLPPPDDLGDAAGLLHAAAARLLKDLARLGPEERARATSIAHALDRAGWPWAPSVLAVIDPRGEGRASLAAWLHLPEWDERPPRGQPGTALIDPEESVQRLADLLGAEDDLRDGQRRYTALATNAFKPRRVEGQPEIVLAEAGTGTGKTVGYLAAAGLWAERNDGAVWISTYTKALQRQVDQELERLYRDPALKAKRAVIRKGRENYLCLLNFQEAVERVGFGLGRGAIVLGLIARWLGATRSGDLIGGDAPSFLVAEAQRFQLTDRRGECIYAACPHYRTCFIERSVRAARGAHLVIANHALVMSQAAREMGSPDAARDRASRFVFDEGHHLFAAADSIFSSRLSAREGFELRRWVRGGEGARRGRGLRQRLGDLVTDEAGEAALEAALRAASALPGAGALSRITEGQPASVMERFLALVHDLVRARSADADSLYDLQCEIAPSDPEIIEAGRDLARGLRALEKALASLAANLRRTLDEQAETLDTAQRGRLDALARGLEWRARLVLAPWSVMAAGLDQPTPEAFVDWFQIAREGGRAVDCGMERHALDPTIPFAETILKPAHGVLITSATLRDAAPAGETDDWRSAEMRTGASHLAMPAEFGSVASPFDYAQQARVFVVRDVERRDPDQLAAAYRSLFLASGGGALGLFTAIQTLRQVHQRIAPAIDQAGLTLLAQHIDPFDFGVLVDMFRAEDDSCLLGTDAARDGVDVPGRALRLIVFDRVPWPRPDILHKARRAAFNGRQYDEMLTRGRLTQAFGRLIRRRDDRGVFVILDSRTPTRLLGGLPPAAPLQRCGLAEAVAETRAFLARS
ncbi:MAG: ATP-dependent DNA helicase [Alphaproteobacteria bacterium]|nr:ATP-dependent DNA helicase [Alphaproteobacteria bacterium]